MGLFILPLRFATEATGDIVAHAAVRSMVMKFPDPMGIASRLSFQFSYLYLSSIELLSLPA